MDDLRHGLLVIAHLDPKKRGSLERQWVAMAGALKAQGVRMHLAVARAPSDAVADELARAGVAWTALDFDRPQRAAAMVADLSRRLQPSLIHLHFLRPLSPVARAAARTRVPVVGSEHFPLNPGAPVLRRFARWLALQLLGAKIDRRVAVSAHVAATVIAVEGARRESVRVIANGVDTARFSTGDRAAARRELGIDPARPVMLCIARQVEVKGIDVAIRAIAELPKSSLLLIAGDGPDEASYAALAQSLGLEERVRFLGLRDDVERLIAACDQVWVPSRDLEAFGMIAAEAMAAGRPVVATRCGGLPEVVVDGVTGIIVPIDDPGALAAAATSLLDDPARAAKMGRAGRARATTLFSLERFVDRTLALYRELVPRWAVPDEARSAQ